MRVISRPILLVLLISTQSVLLVDVSADTAAKEKRSREVVTPAIERVEPAIPPRPAFATRKIRVGARTINVEVADTDQKRTYGLMFRRTLGKDTGMLFVFDSERTLSFWMKNTRIPLSIAYIDAKRVIVEIRDMMPASDVERFPVSYVSKQPVQFALEMNLGWFAKNKIKVGDKISFL